MSFPEFSEGRARRDDHAGFLHQFHGKLSRIRVPLRERRPYEHGPLRVRDIPADFSESAAQRLHAFLIIGALYVNRFLGAFQSRGNSILQRKEHAVVKLGAHIPEGTDDIAVAHNQGRPRAGHVVGLGKRVKFDADFLRAFIGQEGAARASVVNDIGIRVVMDDDGVVFFCPGDEFPVEGIVRNRADRIERVGDQDIFRLTGRFLRDFGQAGKITILLIKTVGNCLHAAQFRTDRKNRVAGIRNQGDIAGIAQSPGDVRHTFLRSGDGHDLFILKRYAEAP